MIVIAMAFAVVLATIAAGIYFYRKEGTVRRSARKTALLVNAAAWILVLGYFAFFVLPGAAYASETAAPAQAQSGGNSNGLGLIAMALSTGLATIGTGYAVAAVGSSALGAVSEDPKLLGKTLIFVGLAEGIAIYGLIISILIMRQLG